MSPPDPIAPVVKRVEFATGGTSRYLGAYNSVFDAIRRGVLKPGDQLPPELELARTLGVSLGTTQKALRMLADRGLIVREQGRGTFVSGGATPRRNEQIRNFRFLGDDDRSLLPIYTRVLGIAEVFDDARSRIIFPEEISTVRIARIINVNFEFQLYSRLFLPASLFRSFLDFKADELDGTPLTYYIGEYHSIPIIRSTHRLLACVLPDDACEQIGVPRRTDGTDWDIIGFTHRNAAVSYQHVYMPPHRRRLELRDMIA